MAVTKKLVAFLVFKASDQSLRVVRRNPMLDWDEIAWKVDLTIPMPWGRLAGSIDIVLPDPPIVPPTVELVEELQS